LGIKGKHSNRLDKRLKSCYTITSPPPGEVIIILYIRDYSMNSTDVVVTPWGYIGVSLPKQIGDFEVISREEYLKRINKDTPPIREDSAGSDRKHRDL
jgi:hypothetical protein